MAYTKTERAEAIAKLRLILKPGDTIYTAVEHVSRSGMARDITVRIMRDNAPLNLSGMVAAATDHSMRGYAVRVTGCGMDMGFALVYELSHILFPDGFDCIGDHCPSNDHNNGNDRNHHSSGGYALVQRWM